MSADGVAGRYMKAMIGGHITTCIVIEKKYGLHGYPPEVVSVGLAAIDRGEDPEYAVMAYISGEETP